jgi:hypothetical protein
VTDKAISALTSASSAVGTDELVLNQSVGGGAFVTKRIAVSAFSSGFLSNGGALGTPSGGNGSNITNVNAASLGGATFAAPGAIGSGTSSTGAFTTVSAAGNVSQTLNINGGLIHALTNASTGTGAYSYIQLANATTSGGLAMYGSGFTTTGMSRQNGLELRGSGAGGVTLNSYTNVPIYMAVNNTEVARVNNGNFNMLRGVAGDLTSLTGYIENTFAVVHPGGTGMTVLDETATSGSHHIDFISSGHIMGNISNNANASTSYNTTSDERLKNFNVPQRDIGAIVDGVIVRDAEFLSNPGDRVLSISAQQLAAAGYLEGVSYPDRQRIPALSADGLPVRDKQGRQVFRDQTDEEAQANLWSAEYGRLGILALWAAKDLRVRMSAMEGVVTQLLSRITSLEAGP